MHAGRTAFDDALWNAVGDQVPRRVRAALRAIAIYRECHSLREIGRDERRLLGLMPAIYSGRVEVDAVLDLARRILTNE